MSSIPVETIEPDPAATSISNDETVNKPVEEAPTTAAAQTEEVTATNGSGETKESESNAEVAKNGEAKAEVKDDTNKAPARKPYNNKHVKQANNSKYDPSVLETSDDPKQIRAQVEFYLGDANLPTDKFLWELVDGGSNRDVPIDTICKFGRMRRFQPREAVVAALKESNVLVVSGEEGQEKVRRKVAYDPNSSRAQIFLRSVYVKGFGTEESSSQFDIEAFFAPYGPTNAVRLRRTPDKAFKGSVFVEFADKELADKFLALDPKPKWKGETELEIKSKEEYTKGKEEDIKAGRMQPSEAWAPRGGQRGGRGGRGRGDGARGNGRGGGRGRGDRGGRGRGDRGDRDPDDWKRRREDDRANGFKDGNKNDRKGGQRGGRRGGRDGPNDESNDAKPETATDPAVNEKKRAREDDGGDEQAPAKKVDVKTDAPAESS